VSTEDKKNRPEGNPTGKEEFIPRVGVGFGCCCGYISLYFVNAFHKVHVNVKPSLLPLTLVSRKGQQKF